MPAILTGFVNIGFGMEEKIMDISHRLRHGQVGVLPTDTLYGVAAYAFDSRAVERIYEIKQRSRDKPLIILIDSIERLKQFNIELSPAQHEKTTTYWPGPYSLVLPSKTDELAYLHRGGQSLAFRLPDKPELQDLLRRSGPIVAPSANPEGRPPAVNIEQAKEYFGSRVDFYVDGGELQGKPSTLVKLEDDGSETTLRF